MKKITGLLLALLLPLLAHGQTVYNQFGPATGILKGQTSTPITTAATAADIVALWASCSANEYLNQSGTCDLVSLAASVTGTLPVANGGTNLTGATDDHAMVGNGTTWQSKALTDCNAADSAVTYDTATNVWGCNSISGGGTGANPTGTVGLSAVNGSAITFMRSDGAPALSQSIAPTWTGTHTYSQTVSGVSQAPVLLASNLPGTIWNSTGSASDAKHWVDYATGNTRRFTAYNEAGSTEREWARVTRSGVGVTGITLGNATDNTTLAFLGTGAVTSGGVILAPAGAVGAPAFALSADTNTGLYSANSDSLSASAGGILAGTFGVDGSGGAGLYMPSGSAALPSLAFIGDGNTGRARLGADQMCDTTGGTCRVTIGPGVQVGAPTGGDQGAGTVNATGLFINGATVRSGTVGPTVGGTGLTSYTTGDLVYASGSNTLARRAAGTTGDILVMSGGVPTWAGASSAVQTQTTSTATVTGCTTAPTTVFKFTKTGNVVTFYVGGVACTSNAVTFTLTNAVPVGYRPVGGSDRYFTSTCSDANVFIMCEMLFPDSSGTVTMITTRLNTATGGASDWTASLGKGLNAFSGSYSINQ